MSGMLYITSTDIGNGIRYSTIRIFLMKQTTIQKSTTQQSNKILF
jgi:hypothetical protein